MCTSNDFLPIAESSLRTEANCRSNARNLRSRAPLLAKMPRMAQSCGFVGKDDGESSGKYCGKKEVIEALEKERREERMYTIGVVQGGELDWVKGGSETG
eukprot:TRINITY_DN1851_c0_g1_i3.p5 TRINITY_DN1851_c0_g1~~TRINITY_DN1851_c0_g1_i3.p5  ORF type:complete len:100 (-),score=15.38 TRINITY_DN1851_c0_g1_i3:583-882(-)